MILILKKGKKFSVGAIFEVAVGKCNSVLVENFIWVVGLGRVLAAVLKIAVKHLPCPEEAESRTGRYTVTALSGGHRICTESHTEGVSL